MSKAERVPRDLDKSMPTDDRINSTFYCSLLHTYYELTCAESLLPHRTLRALTVL
jgi:hypothetical protein